jgi:hypothetical protein
MSRIRRLITSRHELKRYQRAIVERNELRAKVDELGAANSRYEYVRKLHPSDFAYVFWLNAYGDGSFDDLVGQVSGISTT